VIERDLRIRIGTDARRVAEQALAEDGSDDVTSAVCVAPGQFGTAGIEFRTAGILAGTPYADAVTTASELGPVIWNQMSGAAIPAGTTVGVLQGDLARILRVERTLLNVLQRAVGIATATRASVDAVAGTGARILHTRKTAPGLRLLDISAVVAGGGQLHRLDLAHTLMVKDNHWRALEQSGRKLTAALADARARGVQECQVEVESAAQVEEACAAGATRLMVDNQSPDTVRTWAATARRLRPGIEIEATGGINLTNVRGYAEAGADYISIGALTHSVRAADVSLEVKREK
jgi:nicotinate-nucleotide pyrophosphorylase (carboxylating)